MRTVGPSAILTALTCLWMLGGCSAQAPTTGSADQSMSRPARAALQAHSGDETFEESPQQFNTETYDSVQENSFVTALTQPQSTFSIDVDTASYANVRRMIGDGVVPPGGAVRLEEFVNYFSYDYPNPDGEHPFSVATEVAACPWNEGHQLLRIGLKGKPISADARPPCNLVFLLDVSGSMLDANKLPLVKSAMRLLTGEMTQQDRVAIAVYAGASGLVLESTPGNQAATILSAIDRLQAGGSTNGGEGIQLAYRVAQKNFIDGGVNRVLLCTDGDFNVGTTSQSELVDLIEEKAKSNVFLTVLGFGSGNLKDSTMEKIADKGNGNYAYIDSLLEARKVLVEQIGATLITIAKDVKIQVDFNPQHVQAYRLLGYENRMLANRDFRDDTKDAGEIGAGHTVTAFYELAPTGMESPSVDHRPSEFVTQALDSQADARIMLTVNLRYKQPDASTSQEFQVRLPAHEVTETPSQDFQFASAVLACGMLLRESQYAGSADWDWIVETAQASTGSDRLGLRAEFVQLAKTASRLIN